MSIKIQPYVTDAVQGSSAPAKPGAQEKAAVGNAASSDRLQLSKDYHDLAQVQKTMGTNEVRTDKVQQIKNQLENGTYQVNPGAIAGKMLDEIV